MCAVGEGGDQRWAPFPVQDWSRMPEDPASGPPAEPTWGPPVPGTLVPAAPVRLARPWWMPLVVLLCLGLVVGSGTWLARRTPRPGTAALAFVPADGHAAWQRVSLTRETVTQTATQVSESARFAG